MHNTHADLMWDKGDKKEPVYLSKIAAKKCTDCEEETNIEEMVHRVTGESFCIDCMLAGLSLESDEYSSFDECMRDPKWKEAE